MPANLAAACLYLAALALLAWIGVDLYQHVVGFLAAEGVR